MQLKASWLHGKQIFLFEPGFAGLNGLFGMADPLCLNWDSSDLRIKRIQKE